jgi:hypothetical protein
MSPQLMGVASTIFTSTLIKQGAIKNVLKRALLKKNHNQRKKMLDLSFCVINKISLTKKLNTLQLTAL